MAGLHRVLLGAVLCSTACTPVPRGASLTPGSPGEVRVPGRYDAHVLTIPVRVGDEHTTRFAFDTGIGIHLISTSLCARLRCVPSGMHTGKRMSGQALTVPLARVPSLTVGSLTRRDVIVGLIDIAQLGEKEDVEGFLGLGFFADRAVTLEPGEGGLVVEDDASLARRRSVGTAVPIAVVREGSAVTVTLPLTLPGGQAIHVEVDSGSDALILDARFLSSLGVDVAAAQTKEGEDETGHRFRRMFVELPGDIGPTAAPSIRQPAGRTMFQSIIYDGLVGHRFLKARAVTIDVAGQGMIFGPALAEHDTHRGR